jgi:hypothetical protein
VQTQCDERKVEEKKNDPKRLLQQTEEARTVTLAKLKRMMNVSVCVWVYVV